MQSTTPVLVLAFGTMSLAQMPAYLHMVQSITYWAASHKISLRMCVDGHPDVLRAVYDGLHERLRYGPLPSSIELECDPLTTSPLLMRNLRQVAVVKTCEGSRVLPEYLLENAGGLVMIGGIPDDRCYPLDFQALWVQAHQDGIPVLCLTGLPGQTCELAQEADPRDHISRASQPEELELPFGDFVRTVFKPS